MTDAIARGFYLSNDIKYPNWKEGAGNGILAAVIPIQFQTCPLFVDRG